MSQNIIDAFLSVLFAEIDFDEDSQRVVTNMTQKYFEKTLDIDTYLCELLVAFDFDDNERTFIIDQLQKHGGLEKRIYCLSYVSHDDLVIERFRASSKIEVALHILQQYRNNNANYGGIWKLDFGSGICYDDIAEKVLPPEMLLEAMERSPMRTYYMKLQLEETINVMEL